MAEAGAVAVVEDQKAGAHREGLLVVMRRGGSSARGTWELQLSSEGWMTLACQVKI